MQAISAIASAKTGYQDFGPRNEDRCCTAKPSRYAAIAASSAIPPSRSRWECREDTLKEILGGFRFAAFVHHHKSRHRAEMRDQRNIHPVADMHLGRF